MSQISGKINIIQNKISLSNKQPKTSCNYEPKQLVWKCSTEGFNANKAFNIKHMTCEAV